MAAKKGFNKAFSPNTRVLRGSHPFVMYCLLYLLHILLETTISQARLLEWLCVIETFILDLGRCLTHNRFLIVPVLQ